MEKLLKTMQPPLIAKVGRPLKPGTFEERKRRAKHAARKRVAYALKTGRLVKPLQCTYADCEAQEIEAHHADYFLALSVVWLCRKHHAMLHKSLSTAS